MKTFQPGIVLLAILVIAALSGCRHLQGTGPTIEGRWIGHDLTQPTEQLTVSFSGNRFIYWDSRTNELGRGTYSINDNVQPAQIDLTFEMSVAPEFAGKVSLAIYELNGEELKIAGNDPGNPRRPVDFTGGHETRVFSWKRE